MERRVYFEKIYQSFTRPGYDDLAVRRDKHHRLCGRAGRTCHAGTDIHAHGSAYSGADAYAGTDADAYAGTDADAYAGTDVHAYAGTHGGAHCGTDGRADPGPCWGTDPGFRCGSDSDSDTEGPRKSGRGLFRRDAGERESRFPCHSR